LKGLNFTHTILFHIRQFLAVTFGYEKHAKCQTFWAIDNVTTVPYRLSFDRVAITFPCYRPPARRAERSREAVGPRLALPARDALLHLVAIDQVDQALSVTLCVICGDCSRSNSSVTTALLRQQRRL